MLLEYETVHYSKAIILHKNQLIIKTLNPSCRLPHCSTCSPSFWLLLCFQVVRGMRANTINHLTPGSPFFFTSLSLSIRVINAGKSMLNEDQASCEKLFVKKPSGKHRNSTLLEDNGVSEGKTGNDREKGQRQVL